MGTDYSYENIFDLYLDLSNDFNIWSDACIVSCHHGCNIWNNPTFDTKSNASEKKGYKNNFKYFMFCNYCFYVVWNFGI